MRKLLILLLFFVVSCKEEVKKTEVIYCGNPTFVYSILTAKASQKDVKYIKTTKEQGFCVLEFSVNNNPLPVFYFIEAKVYSLGFVFNEEGKIFGYKEEL